MRPQPAEGLAYLVYPFALLIALSTVTGSLLDHVTSHGVGVAVVVELPRFCGHGC